MTSNVFPADALVGPASGWRSAHAGTNLTKHPPALDLILIQSTTQRTREQRNGGNTGEDKMAPVEWGEGGFQKNTQQRERKGSDPETLVPPLSENESNKRSFVRNYGRPAVGRLTGRLFVARADTHANAWTRDALGHCERDGSGESPARAPSAVLWPFSTHHRSKGGCYATCRVKTSQFKNKWLLPS
jgi:hypothetical protein